MKTKKKYCTFVTFLLAVHHLFGSCRNRPLLLLLCQAEDQTVQNHPCPLHQNSGGESPGGLVDAATQHLPQLKDQLLYTDVFFFNSEDHSNIKLKDVNQIAT